MTLNLCIEGIRLIAPPGLQFEAQHGSPLTGVKMWPKGLWDRQEGIGRLAIVATRFELSSASNSATPSTKPVRLDLAKMRSGGRKNTGIANV